MYHDNSPSFFNELKEWSERKLQLIQHYLDGASRIMGSVYYVDGFAGAGLYEKDGDEPKPGSPVRAAALAQLYEDRSYSFDLHCITVEEDFESFTMLEQATATYGHLVHNLHGTFAGHLSTILQMTSGRPVVCFLDPFGVKGIELEAIKRFLRRPNRTDLWVRFDVSYALRLWGRLRTNHPDDPSHRALLKNVYGIFDEDLLYREIDGPDPAARQRNALDLYKRQLHSILSGGGKREAFTESYRIGSLEQEEKYHLVFGCRHPAALALASDVVCGIEETYQREVERYRQAHTGQLSMFETFLSDEQLAKQKVDMLECDIVRLCRGSTLTCAQVHHRLLQNSWFGIITKTHVRKALANLEKAHRLTRSGPLSEADTHVTFLT